MHALVEGRMVGIYAALLSLLWVEQFDFFFLLLLLCCSKNLVTTSTIPSKLNNPKPSWHLNSASLFSVARPTSPLE
jgi:hypothetical protein